MTKRQQQLRLRLLELIRKQGFGHSGRALSAVDLMEALYFGEENGRLIFNHDPSVPQHEDRDFFVLSKQEALPALYAVLEARGYRLPEPLPRFTDRKVPGIELTTSQQAYGIAYAAGLAKSIQADRGRQQVFCLAGDYELRHGMAWEVIMEAAEQRLDSLCLIIDENDPKDLYLQDRFDAFGWKLIKLPDAHDHDEIVFAYMKARVTQRRPVCIWAPTLKSAGVPFAERKPEYDDVVFSDPEMEELTQHYQRLS